VECYMSWSVCDSKYC